MLVFRKQAKAGIPKFFPLQEHGGFEMTRSSKKFALTSASMQLLSLVNIDIAIYQGNIPGDKKDTMVGTVSVPMMDVLKDGSINGKIALKLEENEKKPYEVR